MKIPRVSAALLLLALSACVATPVIPGVSDNPAWRKELAACNVAWDTPSRDSFDSMPLSGMRGAGANVWFQDGSLWLYLAHSGAWAENSELLKLGALRLTPVGADFSDPKSFRQELDLPSGTIRIAAEAKDGTKIALSLWFAEETLVVESSQDRPLALEVEYGSWRARPGAPASDPEQVAAVDGVLRFCHRNGDAIRARNEAKHQHVPEDAAPRVTQDRVFGGALAVRGGLSFDSPKPVRWQTWNGHAWPARTPVAKEHLLAVALGAARHADPAVWQARAQALLAPDALDRQRAKARERWEDFWGRSHVFVQPAGPASDPAFQIGRNYQNFRYMTACNQGGEMPLKFNGGIFAVEARGDRVPGRLNNAAAGGIPVGGSPDFMRWSANMYMSQNQRWIGWPAVAGGDADILAVSRAFYRDRLQVAKARAANLGAQGACYIEPMNPEGLCCVEPTPQGLCGMGHLTHHFSMGLEHAWMALRGHDAMGTDVRADLPWMVEQVRFFDSFYRAKTKARTGKELSDAGRLCLYPCNGLELTLGATNPVETVAGLRRVVAELLRRHELPAADRAYLEKVRPTLPDIPTTTGGNGDKILALADKWEGLANPWEIPEIYVAWPYRLAGVLHPDTLAMARATWDTKCGSPPFRTDFSWQPNVANVAALGLTDEAKERAIAKMADTAGCMRFPAFFGPGHDWMPDHNWGGSGMVGIQEMLMACEDDEILLLPAWPKEWDVDFKLHAPKQTVVECAVKGGQVVKLKVTPESRRKDVKLTPLQATVHPKPLSEGKPSAASSTCGAPYEAAKAVDGDPGTRWAAAGGARQAWLEVDLGKPTTVSRAVIMERAYASTRKFAVEALEADGSWTQVAEGTTIGRRREVVFPLPHTAQKFRLNLKELADNANIEEFQLFE